MERSLHRAIVGFSLVAALLACRKEPVVALDFTQRAPPPAAVTPAHDALRVAVGAMVSPEATFDAYTGLIDVVAGRIGRRTELVQRRTYEEINRMLLNGEVDVAFICTGAYVAVRDRVRFLAAPVIDGSATYRSYLLARADGPATVEQLRGARFAFTDPLSNTGRLYPIFLLRSRFDLGPRQFFRETVYSGGHDESIRMLLDGHVEAAAVDGAVFDAYARAHPADTARLSVIHRSPAFGTPPIVARIDLDPAVVTALRDTLLQLHLAPDSRAILERIGIQRFAPSADYTFAVRVADVALGGVSREAAP